MQRYSDKTADRYRPLGYDDSEDGLEYHKPRHEWCDDDSPRTVFSAREEVNPSFQVKGSRTPIKPNDIYLLEKGDHVGWHRPIGLYWHHAIVSEVDVSKARIKVVHYSKVDKRISVVHKWLDVKRQKGDLFRFDYTAGTNILNPPDTVLKRAYNKIGESGYKVFANNCEHFATYCKTGEGDCAQVHWFKGKLREGGEALAADGVKASTKLVCSVIKEVSCKGGKLAGAVSNEIASQSFNTAAKSTAKITGAEVLERVGNASNYVGAGAVALIETAHCGYDIYQMHKSKKLGKITQKDFSVCTTQRVSEGVLGGGLSIACSIGGQCLGGVIGGVIGSAIPIIGTAIGTAVGSFVGSIVGGVIGSLIGKASGTIFGRWLGKKLFG